MPFAIAPSVIASWGRTIVEALNARGIDPAPLLSEAGFAADAFADPNARHAAEALRKLWKLAAQAAADPAFGLSASRYMRPATFHALGYAVLASTTLREALLRMVRYSRVVSDVAELSLTEGTHAELSTRIRPGYEAGGEESSDAVLSAIVRTCRALRGERFALLQVRLRRAAPHDSSPWQRFYRCAVKFDAEQDVLCFDGALLDPKLPSANPALAIHNDEAVRSYLARVASGTIVDRVRAALAERAGEKSEPAALARSLGVSLRSMQRALQEHGTSYEELLNEVRRELACAYLREGQHSITEIAFLLGYEHESTFARAFRRWTGKAPSAYRG